MKKTNKIKCTRENWQYSIVASKATFKDIKQFYSSVDDPIVDIDVCEDGGYHLWTDSMVEWFLDQEKEQSSN
jgi:hypothetical protein